MDKKESSLGLIIVVIATLIIVFSSYFSLQYYDKPKPVIESDYQENTIPETSYFLLINEDMRKESIHSVVMATLLRDANILLLSYFPAKASLDGKKNLNSYYKQEGAVGVSNNFKQVFGDAFYFFVLKKSFFESLSPSLKEIKFYGEKNEKTLLTKKKLNRLENENNLYLIKDKVLLEYMNYHNPASDNDMAQIEHNRVLYIISNVVTSVGEVMINIVLKKADHVGKTNYPVEMKPLFPKFFQTIGESDIFTLPFHFIKEGEMLKTKSSVKKFNESIKYLINENGTGVLEKYKQVLSKKGVQFPAKIKIRIINASGKEDLFESYKYQDFKKKLTSFTISESSNPNKKIIDKSFLVNANHDLEVFNYTLNRLKSNGKKAVGIFYNSVQVENNTDVILYLGKDFGTILNIN